MQLDLIPADMIQTIEVSKVVTPDMDGDAIGGSINLVTKILLINALSMLQREVVTTGLARKPS